jgi:TPR repeat protein
VNLLLRDQEPRSVFLSIFLLFVAWAFVACAPQVVTTADEAEATAEATEEPQEAPVVETSVWPSACEDSLEADGCNKALIEKYTRQVCEKNSVAMACVAGVSLQAAWQDVDRDELQSFAATACLEGVDRACVLEAFFVLDDKTARAYEQARKTFRRHCSPDAPAFCMAAGDALLSVGASSEAARPFLDKACQNGVPSGCRLLGIAAESEGKDGSNAFEKGCFAGDVASCKVLKDSGAADPNWAMMPRIGMSRSQLVEIAWKDCQAAKQPDCVLWGEIVLDRMGSTKARPLTESLFDVGCQAGAADACFFYGFAVAHGFDGDPKPHDAARWREKGCSMGWKPACAAPSAFVE